MSCLTWTDLDTYFGGLCTTHVKLETPPSDMKTASCEVCVSPKSVYGECNSCPTVPAKTYVLTVTLDSNGIASGDPENGTCCSNYQGEFLVYSIGGCVWESDEKELNVSSVYTGVSPHLYKSVCGAEGTTARFKLIGGTSLVAGQTVTSWTVQCRYKPPACCVPPSANGVKLLTALGKATSLDCYEPVIAYNTTVDSGACPIGCNAGVPTVNPCFSSTIGYPTPTMTVSIRPL